MMMEKFTGTARQVIEFTDRAHRDLIRAQEEARLLNQSLITPEDILLAVLHESDGVATQVLEPLGVEPDHVRSQVLEMILPAQQDVSPGHIPFTASVKQVLVLSQREALRLDHSYVEPEHILLGLIREGKNMAAQVLVHLGVDLDRARKQVLQLASDKGGRGLSVARASAPRSVERWLSEQILPSISAIGARLSTLEGRIAAPAETDDLGRQIENVRREMQAAARAQEYERAARLRDKETQLLAQRAARRQEWNTAHPKLPDLDEACRQLNDEIGRLQALLRQQGINS